MIFDWYKLFNLEDFEATELASRELIVSLEGIGRTSVLISFGNTISITYNETFLPLNLPNRNPYIEEGYASYIDENEDVWLGIETAS